MSVEPASAGPVLAGGLSGPGVTPPSLNGAGRRFLSDILVELGFVEQAVADQAVEAARRPGMTPERVLLENGAITQDQLSRALAERYALDHIDLDEYAVDRSAAGVLRETAARRYLSVPIGFADDGALVVAIADPTDSLGLSDIAVMTKLAVRPAVAARAQIEQLVGELNFMDEPEPSQGQAGGTLIQPPDDEAGSARGTRGRLVGPGRRARERAGEPREGPSGRAQRAARRGRQRTGRARSRARHGPGRAGQGARDRRRRAREGARRGPGGVRAHAARRTGRARQAGAAARGRAQQVRQGRQGGARHRERQGRKGPRGGTRRRARGCGAGTGARGRAYGRGGAREGCQEPAQGARGGAGEGRRGPRDCRAAARGGARKGGEGLRRGARAGGGGTRRSRAGARRREDGDGRGPSGGAERARQGRRGDRRRRQDC